MDPYQQYSYHSQHDDDDETVPPSPSQAQNLYNMDLNESFELSPIPPLPTHSQLRASAQRFLAMDPSQFPMFPPLDPAVPTTMAPTMPEAVHHDAHMPEDRNDEDVDANEAVGPSRTRVGSRRTRSRVWEQFEELEKENDDGVKRRYGKCKLCQKVLLGDGKSGTSSLKKHYDGHVRDQRRYASSAAATSVGEVSTVHPGGSVSSFQYNPDFARESTARLICAADLPINFAENPFYQRHIKEAFCPQYEPVSRATTRRDIIKYHNKRKDALGNDLRENEYSVALTSDIWTSRAMDAYVSVVAHWIDKNWILQKRVIGFKPIEEAHTGENIASRIFSVVSEWGISGRIIAITFDNATNNDSAATILKAQLHQHADGVFFHQRCNAHIFNLMVQDGLDAVKLYVDRIRDAVRFLNASSTRIADWKAFCVYRGLNSRLFAADMPVRWNSTYMMLKSMLPYVELFEEWFSSKVGRRVLPREEDWEQIRSICSFLEVFLNTTNIVSSVSEPTSAQMLHCLIEICSQLNQYAGNDAVQLMVGPMLAKFSKYFYPMPYLYSFAVILDPRLQIRGLRAMFNILNELIGLDYTTCLEDTREKLFDAFRYYENRFPQHAVARQAQHVRTSPMRKSWELLSRLPFAHASSSSSSPSTPGGSSELSRYLDATFGLGTQHKLDLLSWWRSNESSYPLLSIFARDVLTIPASTVSSEATFSTAGRIIEDRRCSLTPEMVEIITLTKDWELADRRMQNSAAPYNEELCSYFEHFGIESNDDN